MCSHAVEFARGERNPWKEFPQKTTAPNRGRRNQACGHGSRKIFCMSVMDPFDVW